MSGLFFFGRHEGRDFDRSVYQRSKLCLLLLWGVRLERDDHRAGEYPARDRCFNRRTETGMIRGVKR